MKIELVDSQGHAIDVPNDLEHLSPDGWATFKPVSVEAGRTIVGVRVTPGSRASSRRRRRSAPAT